jgi:hypothetical protein
MSGDPSKDSHMACGPRSARPPTPHPDSQPEEQGWVADTDELADLWVVDLEYLDAVDRAGVLSFPASDPPAFSGPDPGPAAGRSAATTSHNRPE